jgi:hypothetical protein
MERCLWAENMRNVGDKFQLFTAMMVFIPRIRLDNGADAIITRQGPTCFSSIDTKLVDKKVAETWGVTPVGADVRLATTVRMA